MAQFEVLEHTADIGVRALGGSLEQLFENAAFGVESIALDPEGVEARTRYDLEAKGDDVESLLVNWLNEVIYCLDGARIAFARFIVDNLTHDRISGHAWGEPRDAHRHPTRLVVKAATYHQLSVRRDENGWVAEVYLDV